MHGKTGSVSKKSIGRPPKFHGPSRVVTMTLPDATLRDLAAIDQDRARAIVEATRIAAALRRGGGGEAGASPVAVERVASGTALITVPFSRLLAAIPGLALIEFQPGRYLVVVEPGRELPDVEIAVLDALDRIEEAGGEERAILEGLLGQLRAVRRSARARTATIILVDVAGEREALLPAG
jgi:hypothetical protein